MAKHRSHSIEFKRQVVQEYLAGETLHGLAHRHDLSRNLIRIWVQKYEAGALEMRLRPRRSRSTRPGSRPSSGWSANRPSNSSFKRGLCAAQLGREARLHP